MKCDKCKYLNIEYAGSGWPPDPPYSELRCGKGHWSGWIEDDQPEVDPWADCQDFQYDPKTGDKVIYDGEIGVIEEIRYTTDGAKLLLLTQVQNPEITCVVRENKVVYFLPEQ